MRSCQSYWSTHDGVQLYAQGWQPDGEARAVLALVHGHGEHSGRYAHVGASLSDAGYVLYAFDLREGRWSRLTDPTSVPDASVLNQDPMPDGSPISRHTYDGVEYLTHLDALFGHGGSRARDGSGECGGRAHHVDQEPHGGHVLR